MSRANLDYLLPLFGLVDSRTSEDGVDLHYGLGEAAEDSQIAADDEGMRGYPVSHAVAGAIAAALDHAVTLKYLVTEAGVVTYAAPWTLLRGVLEPASVATWILIGSKRSYRRERALRVWHHDMRERGWWEDDAKHVAQHPAKHGRDRAAIILQIAKDLGLRKKQVAEPLSYSKTVMDAGEAVGWSREGARALWRECSGFAHGRAWPLGFRSSVDHVSRIRGGYIAGFTLAEEHHEKAARLTHAVLERALAEYAQASSPTTAMAAN